MKINEVIEEVINSFSQSSFIKFQMIIRNQVLNAEEIKMVQNVLTMLLKEKEKENCECMLETIQVFIQKYHSQLPDWAYILLVQLIVRQGTAKNDNHIRALQDTADILRSLFPQRILFQLCCKLVMDDTHTKESAIRINLLQFIRLLVVSMKSETLNGSFPDFIMAVSRIISWTVDIKSVIVRKESEIVIHKLFNLNPNQFHKIVTSLPAGFQERAKLILKDNPAFVALCDGSAKSEETQSHDLNSQTENVITLATNEQVYPRPGLFEKPNSNFQQRYMNNVNHNSESEAQVNATTKNSATVTYNDAHEIIKNFKNIDQNCSFNKVSNETQIVSEIPIRNKKYKVVKRVIEVDKLEHKKMITCDAYHSDDSSWSQETNSKPLRKSFNNLKSSRLDILHNEDSDALMKNIIQELSRYNERHQERKLHLIALIKCIHSQREICWDSYFKTIMFILLETLGDNEGGTRKLAILSIQELAKVEPQRFQEQILLIIEKLLHCFMDMDQGVIEAIRSCVIIFSQYLNVDTLWRTLNILIVENGKEIQSSGLKFMRYVINASSPVIVSSLLIETLSLLNKLTIHRDLKNRKNSIYCLVAIYKKIGDKIWPHLTNFEKNKIRLLQLYIHRLK